MVNTQVQRHLFRTDLVQNEMYQLGHELSQLAASLNSTQLHGAQRELRGED